MQMRKQARFIDEIWKILQRGDTVLWLSLVCLLPKHKLVVRHIRKS